jgi:hypothetical protein
MATQMTNSVPSPLDEAQKNRDNAFTQWQTAVDEANRKEQERLTQPDAPGTSYEDFLKGAMPEQPTTQIDPKKEKARAWITNIADAINAVGGIVGAARGADVAPMASLSAANQQRYNTLVEQRNKEREAYNRGVMQAQSHAMSMSEAYRRKRQQDNAQASALDQAKVNRTRMEYEKAANDYNEIYRQGRDVASDERSNRQESRLWAQHQDDVAYRDATTKRNDAKEDDAHNKAELANWAELPGKKYVRRADYPGFIDDLWTKMNADKELAKEINEKYGTRLANSRIPGAKESEEELHEKIIKTYLGSKESVRKMADELGKYGEPDLRGVEAVGQTKSNEGKKDIPGF